MSLVLLAGCSTLAVVTADPRPFLCPADGRPAPIQPVTVSKKDKLTNGTASQIEGNNLAIEALCGRTPPPPVAPGKKDMPVKAPPAKAVS